MGTELNINETLAEKNKSAEHGVSPHFLVTRHVYTVRHLLRGFDWLFALSIHALRVLFLSNFLFFIYEEGEELQE